MLPTKTVTGFSHICGGGEHRVAASPAPHLAGELSGYEVWSFSKPLCGGELHQRGMFG